MKVIFALIMLFIAWNIAQVADAVFLKFLIFAIYGGVMTVMFWTTKAEKAEREAKLEAKRIFIASLTPEEIEARKKKRKENAQWGEDETKDHLPPMFDGFFSVEGNFYSLLK